jgi:MFS family permease
MSLQPTRLPLLEAAFSERTSLPPTVLASDADEWTIVKVTSLAHFLCHLGELIFPSVMVAVMGEFGLQPHVAAALALLGYILLGVGALPVGLWADAWDPRRILLIYFFAMAGAGLAVALAPDVPFLFAGLTLLGLAASIYHPTGLAMISMGVRQRGKALGINGVAGTFGIALAPLLGSWASQMGMWRLAYGILAALAALSAIIMIVDFKKLPLSAVGHRLSAIGRPVLAESRSPIAGSQRTARASLILLLAAMTLAGFNYRCLVTALPSYLNGGQTDTDSFLPGGIATFLVMLAGGSFGQIIGGVLADRLGARRIYLVLVASLIPLSLLLGFLPGMIVPAAVAAILSVGMFAQQPVENSLLAESTAPGRRSVSYGIKFVLTFGLGALGAEVVGLIWKEYDSLSPVFYLMAAGATLMAGLLLVYLRRTRLARS